MRRTIHHSKAILGLALLLLAAESRAVDQYRLEIPAAVMAGEAETALLLEPRQAGAVDTASHSVRVKNLPSGFRLTPGDFGGGLPISGSTRLLLSVDRGVKPGRYAFRIEKSDDAKVAAIVGVRVEAPVAKLAVSPAVAKFSGRIGDPLPVQIIAFDAQGAIVSSFRGAVDLDAAVGTLQGGPVAGGDFKDGVARATVKFSSTDAATGLNKLRAVARNFYLPNGDRVQGALDVALKAGQ